MMICYGRRVVGVGKMEGIQNCKHQVSDKVTGIEPEYA